jgi:ABC-type dipeptide/oligopeptide/nickel transport system permease component
MLVDAIVARDLPLVQGSVLVVSVIFIVVNLLVDLSYAAINPKVRYG